MSNTNRELIQLMSDLNLEHKEVARQLNVPLLIVNHWTELDDSKDQEQMPESELLLLKFTLMSENRLTHLF